MTTPRYTAALVAVLLGMYAVALLGLCTAAHADDGGATWQLNAVAAPTPPPGVEPAQYPIPLGEVGDIKFWAPNRGLLITGGTGGQDPVVAAGVYDYDGVSWHHLATVCGGGRGRIAWAGPDEFWTIADQLTDQTTGGLLTAGAGQNLSLCHFLDGQVVGSYAMPLEGADSYRPMDAAACRTPSDCWFGGALGTQPDSGAFHLHWDGHTMTAVYSSIDHAVSGMATFAGALYESVGIEATDVFPSFEEPTSPPLVHLIAPPGSSQIFRDVTQAQVAYPPGITPEDLQGPILSADGEATGAGATQLWAAGGGRSSSTNTPLTVLRLSGGQWTQVTPNPETGSSLALASGGSLVYGLAAEPGSNTAWVSVGSGGPTERAEVVHLDATGALLESDLLPLAAEPSGPLGSAGPIACPAVHECWVATDVGWLFHLTDGTPLPQDTDPAFQTLITYRPPDDGVPQVLPDEPPPDDSLANQIPAPVVEQPPVPAPVTSTTAHRARALVLHLHSRLVHRTTLEFSFTLSAKARVQLLARRGGRVVARTLSTTLPAGNRYLLLQLNPRRWPTKLDFKAKPVVAK